MWKVVSAPKTVRVTRKLATDFAEMDPAPQDRPLSERRLQVYERIARSGGFRPVSWAKAHCTETGGLYRVNGKHTSTLLSGMDPLPEIYATIEEYVCDTLEDVARLYGTYDSKLQSRTASDINASFAATVPEFADISRRVIDLCVSAVAYSKFLDQYTKLQSAERAELILDEIGFVWFVAGILSNTESKNFKPLARFTVVAAMYGSFHKAQAKSLEFWTAVRDESGPTPHTPDRKLARFLLTSSPSGSSRVSKRKADSREFYVRSIHAWNAWRKGEGTNLNYYKDAKIPAFV